MQPLDWAKSLTTDYEPVDLLLSPDVIGDELNQKFAERDRLLAQIQDTALASQTHWRCE